MNPFKSRVSLFALILACSCIIVGCGSDTSPGVSASRKDQKPAGEPKAKVFELLIDGPSGPGGTMKPVTRREMGSPTFEATPPNKAGRRGISQEEVDAALRAYKQIDPQTIEVIPPRKPGERGLTQRQVDALKPTTKKLDPQTIEVIPPGKPGERGLTRQQVEALKPAKVIDPQLIEVTPPSKPGGRGLTQQEASTITASQKESFDDAPKPPSMPPTKKLP